MRLEFGVGDWVKVSRRPGGQAMRDQFFRVTEIQGDEIHCEGGLIGNADHGPRSMSRCFHRNRIVRVLPPKEAAKISRRMGRAAPAEEKASAGSS